MALPVRPLPALARLWQPWRRWRDGKAQAWRRAMALLGAKRTVPVETMGLPVAARVDPAKPHDVRAGRELLDERLGDLPRVQAVVADRGHRGLARLAVRRHVRLGIKAPPRGRADSSPIGPLWRVEHAFARLGRWRRLFRCCEGTPQSARAWLEVAALGCLLGRL